MRSADRLIDEVNKVQYQPNVIESGTMATAAAPSRWEAGAIYQWGVYDGGYCRAYEAHTVAHAYGPKNDSGYWTYTDIFHILTHASLSSGNKSAKDACINCHFEGTKVRNKIGCFWPAHGGSTGYHLAYMVDHDGRSLHKVGGWSH